MITLNACDFKRAAPRLSFSEPLSLSTTVCATVGLRSATVQGTVATKNVAIRRGL